MLSKTSGKLFKIVIRWCNVCGGMPFIWNGRRGQVCVCVTRKGQIRWWFAFIIQFGLSLHTYFRLFQIMSASGDLQQCTSSLISTIKIDKMGLSDSVEGIHLTNSLVKLDVDVALCFVHAVIHTFMVALSVNTVLKQRAIVLFTNSYLKFTAHFREAYITRLRRSWKNGCEDLVQIMITLAISTPLLPTIHFIANPWHPVYLTYHLVSYDKEDISSGIPNIDELSSIVINKYGFATTIILLTAYAVFQVIFTWIITSTMLFLTVNVTISAFVFRSAIREMTFASLENKIRRKRGNPKYHQYLIPIYVTKDKLRTCSSLIRCYRAFQIVETLAHHCFSGLAFIMEALTILAISLLTFVLLKFSQKMTTGSVVILILLIIIGYSIWTFILSIVGQFKSRTKRCCQSWKFVKCSYLDEIRYMKVVKRSCHPITIWAGDNIFEMKIKHVPTFLYAVACTIIVWNIIYRNYYC